MASPQKLRVQEDTEESPIRKVARLGQSIWLDYIDREFIQSGQLKLLIEREGVVGLTSNPVIFEKAIGHTDHYDSQIKELLSERDWEVKELFEALAIQDIQNAADSFWKVSRSTFGRDGFVSFEVAPSLALETELSILEARRLWGQIKRENVMIKIPGTSAGVPTIRQLISEGINVNVTLLFSRQRYKEVAEAYLSGLEACAAHGGALDQVASVASFFVSRIDIAVDHRLSEVAKKLAPGAERDRVLSLRGKVAIANAKLAYQEFLEIYQSERWKKLEALGARPQRLLWASTSTKDPAYRDVIYVEELIGRFTVNTTPLSTFQAFLDHGRVRESLTENIPEAHKTLQTLQENGISLDEVTEQLTSEAIEKFSEPFDQLMVALEQKKLKISGRSLNSMEFTLHPDLEIELTRELNRWRREFLLRKLWSKDSSLWTGGDEGKWLGWMNIVEHELRQIGNFEKLADEIQRDGFENIALLGMGGSSLAPEVFGLTFNFSPGFPVLKVLDSVDPEQILTFSNELPLSRTLFVVSSKSGTTLEPNVLLEYFFEKIRFQVNEQNPGSHFIAITDPGSELEVTARKRNFRHIFYGVPIIGGRFSALSDFGVVPLAMIGAPVKKILEETQLMVHHCSPNLIPQENPGARLGVALGTLAKQGRDKVTLICAPEIRALGTWIEQLLAESTGKEGKGLIPIVDEELGSPEVYGKDRQFYFMSLQGFQYASLEAQIGALEKAGYPMVRIQLRYRESLGQEFFRWEMATAIAGSLLHINPFDQPDVEASKVVTRGLIKQFEQAGAFSSEMPFFEDQGIQLFSDQENIQQLQETLSKVEKHRNSLAGYLAAHIHRARPDDYFSILAFLNKDVRIESHLQRFRILIRDRQKVATSLGFGPRYLHSTGQLHKGGPNTGVFLQLTEEKSHDVAIPGRHYNFGTLMEAEARGDFQILLQRGRRALRVHFSKGYKQGLEQFDKATQQAFQIIGQL